MRWVGVVLGAAVMLLPSVGRANGIQSHMYLSELAVEHVPEGELRSVVTDPELREILLTGSIYPDSGYAVDDPYGEWSHWEPFVQAYLEHLQDTYSPPFDSADARREVAFLMGVASHVLADQTFDNLFMRRTEEIDGGSGNLDIGTDTFTVVEEERRLRIETWAPIAEAVAIYAERIPHAVSEDLVAQGLDRLELALWAVIEGARDSYAMYWEEMPWAATHYMDPAEPGAYPFLAEVIAGYWQVLWARLHGAADPEESLIRTVPADGAVNHAVDGGSVQARVTLVFGHGIDMAAIPEGALTLRTGAGDPVPIRVRPTSDYRNTVWLVPEADLAYDTEYALEASGLPTIDGESVHVSSPVLVAFRTRCAPDRLADCPPLPEEWTRPDGPPPLPGLDAGPRRDAGSIVVDAGGGGAGDGGGGGGCGCRAARAGTGGGIAALAGVGLLLLRRRRSCVRSRSGSRRPR